MRVAAVQTGFRRRRRREPRAGGAADRAGGGGRRAARRAARVFRHLRRARDRQAGRPREGRRRTAAGVPRAARAGARDLARRRHRADRDAAIPARVRSACLVYGPDGRRVARYDKIHLFAFARGDERYDEGRTIEPGTDVVTIDLPCGRVGLSVCYDLRFPELYRGMGDARADPRSLGVHRDHRRGALASAAAHARRRESMLRARRGARRRASGRTAHLRPFGADRPVGNGRRGARRGPGDRRRRRRSRERIAKVREELPALTHRVL